MTISLDGFEVLCRIGGSPEAFPSIKADVARLAEALVRKQMLAKPTDLAMFQDLVGALGDDTVGLVLQTFSAEELKTLVKKLDPHNSQLKAEDAWRMEKHLLALAHRRTRPKSKPRSKVRAKGKAAAPVRAAKALRAACDPKRRAPCPLGTASMGAGDKDVRPKTRTPS